MPVEHLTVVIQVSDFAHRAGASAAELIVHHVGNARCQDSGSRRALAQHQVTRARDRLAVDCLDREGFPNDSPRRLALWTRCDVTP